MTNKRIFAVVGAVALAVVGALPVMAAAPHPPRPAAAPDTLTVTATVADQVCLNGDTVEVTLTAIVDSTSEAGSRWDFTNDGRFDTRLSTNHTVVTRYGDELNITARAGARNREGDRASDTVTFQTLRCEN